MFVLPNSVSVTDHGGLHRRTCPPPLAQLKAPHEYLWLSTSQ